MNLFSFTPEIFNDLATNRCKGRRLAFCHAHVVYEFVLYIINANIFRFCSFTTAAHKSIFKQNNCIWFLLADFPWRFIRWSVPEPMLRHKWRQIFLFIFCWERVQQLHPTELTSIHNTLRHGVSRTDMPRHMYAFNGLSVLYGMTYAFLCTLVNINIKWQISLCFTCPMLIIKRCGLSIRTRGLTCISNDISLQIWRYSMPDIHRP